MISVRVKTLSALSILALSALLFNSAISANAEDQGRGQSKQSNEQGPQVRFGTPTKTISSDADQREYDQQDGGIAGVSVVGSRIFESKVNSGATAGATTVSNLVKHAGNAMPVTKIYSIFWGPSFTATNYQSNVNTFLSKIGSSPYDSVTTQYMPNPSVANSMSFVRTFTDLTTPPTTAPTTASILAEVYKVVVTNSAQAIDPQGLYMVFTNNIPSKINYCAWHGAGSVNKGATFTIAYQPYLGSASGCSASFLTGYRPVTNTAVDAVANVASHEIYETITDPLLNAWYDSANAEIGDKCAWKTATVVAGYYVQTEWSNKLSGCAP